MDKIQKFIESLNKNLRQQVKILIIRITSNNLSGIKIKRLKGFDNLYATRKGKIRVVFRHEKDINIIVNIDYRDRIYKHLE